MKLIRKRIFPSLAEGITIAWTALVLLTGIVPALKAQQVPQIPQQVINGLFDPTSSQKFFEGGRNRFDTEVQILLDRQLSSPEAILQINDDLLRQEELLRQEDLSVWENADQQG